MTENITIFIILVCYLTCLIIYLIRLIKEKPLYEVELNNTLSKDDIVV